MIQIPFVRRGLSLPEVLLYSLIGLFFLSLFISLLRQTGMLHKFLTSSNISETTYVLLKESLARDMTGCQTASVTGQVLSLTSTDGKPIEYEFRVAGKCVIRRENRLEHSFPLPEDTAGVSISIESRMEIPSAPPVRSFVMSFRSGPPTNREYEEPIPLKPSSASSSAGGTGFFPTGE